MKRARTIIYLFTVFAACATLVAQELTKIGIPELQYFNRRQYHGATQNWKITQSNSDFIYFANNEGILEYDGSQWNILKDMGPYNIRSVKNIDNKIYAGSFNEIGFLNNDSVDHLKYTSLASDTIQGFGDFWSIHSWNGNVVFQSEKGLCIFKNDQLQAVIPALSRFIGAFTVNGLLLVQDEVEGLMEVRGSRVYKISGGEIFVGKVISAVLRVEDETVVVGTINDGLFLWNMKEIVPWNVSSNPFLQKNDIFCGVNYGNNYLVFGTIQKGLVITNMQGDIVMVLDKDKGLHNNTVLSVFVDAEGNIWGGLDNGIVKVAFNSNITFIQGYYNLGTGYAMQMYQGNYYFGTNQALFKISSEKFLNPQKTSADFVRIPNSSGQVWTLFSDGSTLLCGHHLGVFQIVDGRAELISPPEINGVWKIISVPNAPNLLIAGTYNGLIVLEKRGSVWKFRNQIKGFNVSSRFIEWDNSGNLWISHGYLGIFKLALSSDLSLAKSVETFSLTAFPSNKTPLVLTKIGTQCLFVGADGLFRMGKDGKPVKENRFDQFFDDGHYPSIITEDKFQNLWYFFPENMGVLRHLEDGSFSKIETPFFSIENQTVQSFQSVFVSDAKNAFFGLEDGFGHYLVGDQKNYDLPFKVHIRSFKAAEDTADYALKQNGNGAAVQKVIPEFPFKSNSFEVEYSATFYEGDAMLYATFLSDVDDKETEWRTTTFRQFTKLKEGTYEFTVRAKNIYGVISKPVSFVFIVLPPWYRTVYAKIASGVLFLAFVLFLFMFFNYRIESSRLNEKKKQQEEFRVKEEILKNEALLAEKELIRLRNDKLRFEMVHKEKELANSTMHVIQKNEFLTLIKEHLNKIKKLGNTSEMEQKITSLIYKIDKDIDSERYWEVFETHLEQVHEEFLRRLRSKHTELSAREQMLCAYIRMGMSSKEISVLMNISFRAVENNRYRLRQKLNLQQGENLATYITQL